MADLPERPRLRRVEAIPTVIDGQEVVCLRDSSGLAEAMLTVPRPVVELLALFDGRHSLLDVQAAIMRRHGVLVPRNRIETFVETLDRTFFLEGERLEGERLRQATVFQESPVRPAFLAGKSYSLDSEELSRDLDAFYRSPEGPGPAGPRRSGAMRGLIAPHIDFARGGPAYAWAYGALAEAREADCFVVLGTAHAGLDGHPFAATGKDFATPFGPLVVDGEVLEALTRRAPGDLFAAELAHRAEHSIEFQAVHLRHLHRDGREVRIVPVLASFVHECLARGRDPAREPAVAGFLDALRDVMATVPRRYCLVAGADLAHVGPRFGDPAPVSTSQLEGIEAEDRALLEVVVGGQADAFFAAVARDGDRRRICGLSPIYALLGALPGGEGRLLRYGQWPDPAGTVTFASVAFQEPVA